uniref:Dynein regulatory complex subunit 7 C-terminal domain-containing protein n=1 Tax=Knipowitschia caucasica TaxID=637954 RepID=A0AAV2JXT9_KNICA
MPQLHQLLLWLLEEEQKTIRDIRNSQRSVRAMVQCRLKEQEDVRLEACPWTTTGTTQFRKKRERLMFAGEEMRWLEEQEKDVLAPFLMRLNGTTDMSPDQAQTVYQDCLQDFRSRMVQHACLLQERIEEETQALQQEDADHDSLTLQIEVARQRLQMHKNCAPQRYRALEQQLRADPRLGPFLTAT